MSTQLQAISSVALSQAEALLAARMPSSEVDEPFRVIARKRLYIRTMDEEIRRFELRPIQKRYLAQKRLARLRGKPPRYLLLKYRRGGFTTVEQGESYYQASRRRNTQVMTMAQDEETTSRIFRIATLMHDRDPRAPEVKGPGNQKRLEFPGLNSLFYMGTAGSRGFSRGDTLSRVHWSEVAWSCQGHAQVEKQRQVLTGITEAASRGNIVLETTPNGSELFRELYLDAKKGLNDWTPIFLPWYEDEYNRIPLTDGEDEYHAIVESLTDEERELAARHALTAEQIKFRRAKVRELKHYFAQEYPENDQTCWLMAGIPYFSESLRMLIRILDGLPTEYNDQLGVNVPAGARLVPGGYEVYWERPQVGVKYCAGCDSSEGIPGCDYGGIGVMRRDNGKQVYSLHGLFNPRVLGDHCARVSNEWNRALIGIERENHGHAVIQRAQDQGLHRAHYQGGPLYHHSHAKEASDEKKYSKAGWSTTPITRPVMLEDLSEWISADDAESRIMDPTFVSECTTFRKQSNGKWEADSGCHDDSLMKWAIAEQMRKVKLLTPRMTVL